MKKLIAEAGVSRATSVSAEDNPWLELDRETSWGELTEADRINRKKWAKRSDQIKKESKPTDYWQAVLDLFEAAKIQRYSDAVVAACRDPSGQLDSDEITDSSEEYSLVVSKFEHSYNRYRTACYYFGVKPAPAQFFFDAAADHRHLENEMKAVSYLRRGHKEAFPAEEIDRRCLRKLGKTQKSS